MNKWLYLVIISGIALIISHLYGSALGLHTAFDLMVLFFFSKTFFLFRLDHWVPKEWAIHLTMVKITLRMLLSLTFLIILVYTQEEKFSLVIQFMVLYLVFMIFEIVVALTNLRRN